MTVSPRRCPVRDGAELVRDNVGRPIGANAVTAGDGGVLLVGVVDLDEGILAIGGWGEVGTVGGLLRD